MTRLSRRGAIASTRKNVEKVGVQAIHSDVVVDRMSVNTHFGFGGTIYETDWSTGVNIKQKLLDLGVRNIRDRAYTNSWQAGQNTNYYTRLRELSSVGFGFDLTTVNTDDISLLDEVYGWTGNAVKYFEGPNEPNSLNLDSAKATQEAIFAKATTDPILSNVKIASFALNNIHTLEDEVIGSTNFDDTSTWTWPAYNYVHASNWHAYPGARKPTLMREAREGATVKHHLDVAALRAKMYKATIGGISYNGGQNEMICSETGYHTALGQGATGHYPVSERTQAIYCPRLLLGHISYGYQWVSFYEFMDDGEVEAQEERFGMVRFDGTLKPVYIAFQNLLSILNDRVDFSPSKLNYTISGGDADVVHHLYQRSTGEFYIAIYQDKDVWDRAAQTDLFPPNQNVTVTFNEPITSISECVTGNSTTFSPLNLTGSPQSAVISVPAEVKVLKVKVN